jgi:hypothetical protein
MFAPPDRVPRAASSPFLELRWLRSQLAALTRVHVVRLWAIRSASLVLAIGIGAVAAVAASSVLFARAPIGGTSGLFALYGATAAVGIGLAMLTQLVGLAKRLTASTTPRAKVISIHPASRNTSERDWNSRPFNAA